MDDNNFVGDIDKAIEVFKHTADEQKKTIDTGITSDGICISTLYADDTELIDNCISRITDAMNNNYQIVSWLKELKTFKEIQKIHEITNNAI